MRVVLDTNVLVSGLLSPYGASGEIVRMIACGDVELCYDARILSEYRSVLLREKFLFNKSRVEALLKQIEFCGYITKGSPLRHRLPDPDDESFLEVAIGGGVGHLVTGNEKHYPVKEIKGVQIISPKRFLEGWRNRK